MIIPEAAFAADGDDPPADPGTGEQTEEPASGELTVEDSYGALKLADAYDQGAIVLPESMQPVPSADDPDKMVDQVTFSKPKYGEGLLLTGKAGVLQSGCGKEVWRSPFMCIWTIRKIPSHRST